MEFTDEQKFKDPLMPTYPCPVCGHVCVPSDERCPTCGTAKDANNLLKIEVPLNTWVSRDRARMIVEGASVIVRKKVDKPLYDKWHQYDVKGWFRPDHIDQNIFGDGTEEYMLLENTIH